MQVSVLYVLGTQLCLHNSNSHGTLGKNPVGLETHISLNRKIFREDSDVWDRREEGLNMGKERQQLQGVGARGKAKNRII